MSTFEEDIERLRLNALRKVDCVRIAVLIWGPSPTAGTPVANVRILLKERLNNEGHYARFSEELFDPTLQRSNFIQQLTQAEAYNLVISIPDSPGSIAEIHDFARIPRVAHKIIVFLNNNWNNGYSNQSLIQLQSVASCPVELYDPLNLPNCIIDKTLSEVRKLQEIYYARSLD